MLAYLVASRCEPSLIVRLSLLNVLPFLLVYDHASIGF